MMPIRSSILYELPPPPPGKTGWPWTEESRQMQATMPRGLPWPMVSIVTPSYNQGEYIEETIRSVLLQGYPSLEYIIMDGGSTDNSVEIILKYENWLAYWVSEQDKGQADAVNKGWQRSSGQILGWINSDDVYAPGAVGLAASTLLANPTVGFVYGDAHVIDAASCVIGTRKSPPFDFEKLVTFDLVPSQPTVFLRRSLIETAGVLDTSLQMSMDTDYWFRLGRVALGRSIPCTMAYMRSHVKAKTTDRYAEFLPDSIVILDKIFNDPTLPKNMRDLRAKAYSHAYYGAAIRAYQAGIRRQILPLALRALCAYPHPFDLRTYLSIFMCIEAITGTSLMKKIAAFRPRRRFIKSFTNLFRRVF